MFRELLLGTRSLLFPVTCAGCRRALLEPETPLCAGCWKEIPWSRPPWCRGCGKSLAGLGAGIDRCGNCLTTPRNRFFDQAISPFRYEGSAKKLITALKYKGRLSLPPFLGRILADTVRERLGPDPADAVLPVPLHPTRHRERTFNQASVLAQALADRLDLCCRPNLLSRCRPTPSQTELPREIRLSNLTGAFRLEPDPLIRSLRLLLVDDVFTTGATVNACAQPLKEAGAAQVVVVTLAHG